MLEIRLDSPIPTNLNPVSVVYLVSEEIKPEMPSVVWVTVRVTESEGGTEYFCLPIDERSIEDRVKWYYTNDRNNGIFDIPIVEIPPEDLSPNWDGFNAYILTDLTFKGYRDTVRPLDGDLNAALFDSYSLVATNGVGAFGLIWGQWCGVSGITAQDKELIATVAESFNLPAEFITVIREE